MTETAETTIPRPVPRPDALSQGFWDASARGELAIQRCADCKLYQHPPRALCRGCSGAKLGYEKVSGEGKLWGWTVTHRNVLAGFEAAVPYTMMVVELKEQESLFVMSDLIGREQLRDSLTFGMAMRAVFPPNGDDPVLPQFEPVGGKS